MPSHQEHSPHQTPILPCLRRDLFSSSGGDEKQDRHRKRARLLEPLVEGPEHQSLRSSSSSSSSSSSVQRLLTLPVMMPRNLATICLEEPDGFSTEAVERLWSSLEEMEPIDPWLCFLRDMTTYQATWAPTHPPLPREQQQESEEGKEAGVGAAGAVVGADVSSQPQAPGESRPVVRQQDLEQGRKAVVEETRRRLQRLDCGAGGAAAMAVSQEVVEAGCREAVRYLLQGHDGVVVSEREWAAVGLEQRGDGLIAALCRAMAKQQAEGGSARDLRAFLSGGLLPHLAAMQAPASRVLAEGIEAVVRRRPRLFVDTVVLALLLHTPSHGEGPGWAQCEACIRLIKKGAFQQEDLEYLLSCLCGGGSSRTADVSSTSVGGRGGGHGCGVVWTDSSMGVMASILSCQPPLSDDTLVCLLESMERAAELGTVGRSLKMVALFNSLLGRYRQRLVTAHRGALERIAEKSDQPMMRAAVSKLK